MDPVTGIVGTFKSLAQGGFPVTAMALGQVLRVCSILECQAVLGEHP